MARTLPIGWIFRAAVLAVVLGLITAWFAVVIGVVDGGQIGRYVRQGAGGGLKLVANVIVISLATICVSVFFRHSLEDLNIIKKKDEWTEWRNEPDPSKLAGPALRGTGPSTPEDESVLPADRWPDRTSIRRRRRPPSKVHWGSIKR